MYTPPWTLHPPLGLLQPSTDSMLLLKTLHPSFDSTSLFGPPPLLGFYSPHWKIHPSLGCTNLLGLFTLLGLYAPSPNLHRSLDSTPLCAGLRIYVVDITLFHLVWSQEPGRHCTYSGSFWSTLCYTVVTVAMSNLALWTLRNPETAQFFECLILQMKGSLGLPRNKRTVVPLFTFYLKL